MIKFIGELSLSVDLTTGERKQEKIVKMSDLTARNLSENGKKIEELFAIYKVVKGIDAPATEDETICHMLIAMESDAVPVLIAMESDAVPVYN